MIEIRKCWNGLIKNLCLMSFSALAESPKSCSEVSFSSFHQCVAHLKQPACLKQFITVAEETIQHSSLTSNFTSRPSWVFDSSWFILLEKKKIVHAINILLECGLFLDESTNNISSVCWLTMIVLCISMYGFLG